MISRTLTTATVLALVTILAGPSRGATIIVDGSGGGDYTLVSEACEAAASGDTVLIRPGEYDEYNGPDLGIVIDGKDLIILGREDAPETVRLRMDFAFRGQDTNGEICGVTMHDEVLALKIAANSMLIRHCSFEDNAFDGFGEGAAILISNSRPVIEDCTFLRNGGTDGIEGLGGGAVSGGGGTLRRCVFVANRARYHGGALFVAEGLVEDCVFIGNEAENGAAVTIT